jgi:hypothetical protein
LSDSPVLRLGTRGSRLALAQTQSVAELLGGAEVVAVSSTDSEPGDKGRFVRGVEQALIAGDVDLGVHSAKDLPGQRPDELRLAGVAPREDPRDAYIGAASSIGELAAGARSYSRCATTWTSSSCGATSTPGSGSWSRGSTTASSSRPPAYGAWTATAILPSCSPSMR